MMKKIFLLLSFLMFSFTASASYIDSGPENAVVCDIGDELQAQDVSLEFSNTINLEKNQKTYIENSIQAKIFSAFIIQSKSEEAQTYLLNVIKNTEKPPLRSYCLNNNINTNKLLISTSGGLPEVIDL